MGLLTKRSYGYSRMGKEDPDEKLHRRAQFLIYKTLQQADVQRKRQSFLSIRLCKMRVKIGKRLKKMRKSMLLTISAARSGAYKQVMGQIKIWKRLFYRRGNIITLPSLLT